VRLTIAIPTLNRAYCVGRAVESALAQTSADVEIIVSDNGSTDDTAAVIARYRDPRLRTFRHDETMSAGEHGAFLIASATGDLFLGLSDDDWLEPEFAERVLAHYREHPEVTFAYTQCWTEMAGMRLPSLPAPVVESSLDFLGAYFAGERQVFWCACVCRTTDLRRLGPQPADRLIGDLFFWSRLACEGPVGCVSTHLAHYTFLVDNTSLGISVRAWSDEHALVMTEVRVGARALRPDAAWWERFEKALSSYLARTTANQFALLAARGAPKRELLAAVPAVASRLSGDWMTTVPRVLVALLAPAPAVRALLIALVRRRARGSSDATV
jgi:glycosyltransferase involved in cell wall biosynthesis